MNTLRILLVDADDDFRSLLTEAIAQEKDLEVCGNTDDGEEALQLLNELQPDVLLMAPWITSKIDGSGAVAAYQWKGG